MIKITVIDESQKGSVRISDNITWDNNDTLSPATKQGLRTRIGNAGITTRTRKPPTPPTPKPNPEYGSTMKWSTIILALTIIALASILVLSGLSNFANAQLIYEEENCNAADIRLYKQDNYGAQDTDAVIYFTDSIAKARRSYKDGIWYRTQSRSQSDIKFCFEDNKSFSDYQIRITDRITESEIRNDSLRNILND